MNQNKKLKHNKINNYKKKIRSNKFRKSLKFYRTLRFMFNSKRKYLRLKLIKQKYKIYKQFYCIYTKTSPKNFNKLVQLSTNRNIFLLERQLNVYLSRLFGGSIEQKQNEILNAKFLVNGEKKSPKYLIKDSDVIHRSPSNIFDYIRMKSRWSKRGIATSLGTLAIKKHLSIYVMGDLKWSSLTQKTIWQPFTNPSIRWQTRIPYRFYKTFKNPKIKEILIYNKKL